MLIMEIPNVRNGVSGDFVKGDHNERDWRTGALLGSSKS